jgi:hypothetical protein
MDNGLIYLLARADPPKILGGRKARCRGWLCPEQSRRIPYLRGRKRQERAKATRDDGRRLDGDG